MSRTGAGRPKKTVVNKDYLLDLKKALKAANEKVDGAIAGLNEIKSPEVEANFPWQTSMDGLKNFFGDVYKAIRDKCPPDAKRDWDIF